MSNGIIKKGQTGKIGTPDESSQTWSKSNPWRGKAPGTGGDYYEWEEDTGSFTESSSSISTGDTSSSEPLTLIGELTKDLIKSGMTFGSGGGSSNTNSFIANMGSYNAIGGGLGQDMSNLSLLGSQGGTGGSQGKGSGKSAVVESDVILPSGVEKHTSPITPPVAPVITNALPSLPSISNIGAIPFTGVVNWNAIPGGFQPLPQTAGGRKKLYQLSQFHGGINQKSSPRDIADFECQKAENITVSQVGRIKLLGDIKSQSSGLSTDTLAAGGATHIPCSGYGLYIFKSGYSLAATPVEEECDIVAAMDGRYVRLIDNASSATATGDYLDIAGADTNVAPVFYAAGNGLYACDANFAHTTARQCAINVYRVDDGSNQTVTGWKTGKPLIDSPTYDSDTDDAMAAGTVKCTHDGGTAEVASTMIVECDPNSTTGTWNGTYYIYVSWLFDSGVETGLTSIGTDDGDDANSTGIAFSNEELEFNISLMHTPHATANTELGANKRIEGGRIYFKKSDGNERYLLGEFNLIDGVKGALDSTFTPWTEGSDVYSHTTITFSDPPEVYTYLSLNAYSANEAYDVSADNIASTTTGSVAHDVRYKTAVVGQQGVVFIGNVQFKGRHMPDMMMFSMPNKPGVFPKFNFFDSPSSDGSPIIALAAFQDTILQFKQNAMYVINISNPALFYAEASFRDCGVFNPCQVFTTAFGVIFANKNGCFIYDGQKVISLTNGKFNIGDWGISESSSITGDAANVPCIGYDPRSQSIIVLKDIGDNSENDDAWVYNMVTQSWTEGIDMITNTNADRHTNFQISPNGYLSICQDSEEVLKSYSVGNADNNTQTITYITKDIDFGLPTQTKKIFKIYVTYSGNADALTGTYGADGDTSPTTAMTNSETSDATLQDAGVTDHNVATFTLDSHPSNLKSIMLKFTGSCGEDFEINDISILYRSRPIK